MNTKREALLEYAKHQNILNNAEKKLGTYTQAAEVLRMKRNMIERAYNTHLAKAKAGDAKAKALADSAHKQLKDIDSRLALINSRIQTHSREAVQSRTKIRGLASQIQGFNNG